MKGKCVSHIKRKAMDTTSFSGEIDDRVVEQIMLTTFDHLNENRIRCNCCQNRSRIRVFSMCKINHHLQPNCNDNSLDIGKFMKKNYHEIMSSANELHASDISDKLGFHADLKEQIVYESINLFEQMRFGDGFEFH